MRASVLPNLPKERLVIIRGSFLRLCDDDHCAAALLNVFVYWHDWSLDRQRQDAAAAAADPDHRPAEPGHWIWRTMQDLTTDLLGLSGEKVVRRAVTLLEDKCFIETRGNPRDPRDRTRQFRLRFETLEAALTDLTPNDGLQTAKMPNANGKNAASAESTTCGESKWQKDQMQTAKMPLLLGKEIKDSERSSSSLALGVVAEKTTMTGRRPPDVTVDSVQEAITNWAVSENLRRMRDDGGLGPPAVSHTAWWAAILAELGIADERDVRAVMATARAGAEKASGGGWRRWSFLSLQVQLAAEKHLLARTWHTDTSTEPEVADEATSRPLEQPSKAELAAELEELRGAAARLNAERDCRCRGNPYAETGELDRHIGSIENRAATLAGRLRAFVSSGAGAEVA